ncbi:MAG: LysM peptidoglycan-binding domain-containing protein, partial [Pseudomonadota bacterium]
VVGTTTYRYLSSTPPEPEVTGEAAGTAGAVASADADRGAGAETSVSSVPVLAEGRPGSGADANAANGPALLTGTAPSLGSIEAALISLGVGGRDDEAAGATARVDLGLGLSAQAISSLAVVDPSPRPVSAATATVILANAALADADATWGFGSSGRLIGRADESIASLVTPGPSAAARVVLASAADRPTVSAIRQGGTILEAAPVAAGRSVSAPRSLAEAPSHGAHAAPQALSSGPIVSSGIAGAPSLGPIVEASASAGEASVASSPVAAASLQEGVRAPVREASRITQAPSESRPTDPEIALRPEPIAPGSTQIAAAPLGEPDGRPIPLSADPVAIPAAPEAPTIVPVPDVPVISARSASVKAQVPGELLTVTDWRASGAKVITVLAPATTTEVEAGISADGVGILRPGPKVLTVSRGAELTTPIEVAGRGQVKIEAVRTGASRIVVRGRGQAGTTVTASLNGTDLGEIAIGEDARFELDMPARMLPGAYELRIEPRGAAVNAGGSATVGFRLDQDLRQVRTRRISPLNARARAETVAVEAQPHVVVIKRGDNLWRISRRVYGDGFSFPTIVNANRDLIRNPDLIFPGQVFVLPLLETHRIGGTARG